MTEMACQREPRVSLTHTARTLLLTALVCAAAGLAAACGGDSSTSPSKVDLTGAWAGTTTDSTGNAIVTATLAQSGSSLSGTGRMQSTGATATATIAGTVSGASITFTWTIPVGGYSAPLQACSATLTGSASVASGSFVGSYSGSYGGSGPCAGPIANGVVTMTRQ